MTKEKINANELTHEVVCKLFKDKTGLNYCMLIKDGLYYKKVELEEALPYLIREFTLNDSYLQAVSSILEFFSENYSTRKFPYFSISLGAVPLMNDEMLCLFYSEEDLNAHIDYLIRTQTEEVRKILNQGYTHVLKVNL